MNRHRALTFSLALALALTALTPLALARCRVVPGPEGAVSAWLVAGPFSAGRLASSGAQGSWRSVFDRALSTAPALPGGTTEPTLRPGEGLAWRGASDPRTWLDVGSVLRGRGARVAYAGLTLETAREGDRYLFLGTDDAVLVLLDGREVYRRASARDARDDDDAVRLHLTAGRHALVLKLVSRGDLDLFARLTDETFNPDPTLTLELPGVDDTACGALAARSADVSLARRVTASGLRLEASVEYPGGTTRTDAEAARGFELDPGEGVAPSHGSLSLEGPFVRSLSLTATVPDTYRATATARVSGRAVRFGVSIPGPVREALARAATVLPTLDPLYGVPPGPGPYAPPRSTPGLPPEAIWSVEHVAERLSSLVADGDSDTAHLLDEAATLRALLDGLAAGRDPYVGRRGPMRRGYRSPLDGSIQGYSLYVPASYDGRRPFPLVVGLHGLHGSAHRMLPVLFGLYDEGENRTHAERHLPSLPDAQAILVAPFGHGDVGYRQMGEYDVLRAVEEVRRAYRVDPDRTYMTGLSMGGIGASGVPFHHPDLFAASAPLCGYHSYFVRGDTQGVRRPWEPFLMELRSPASYAENGFALPMYIVQGTLDRPLAHSQVLVDRYTALRYRVEFEWPELPHNVWGRTYANGRIIPYFLQFRRDPSPRRVRFRTPDLRWRQSYWVTLDALETRGRWGEVDLRVERNGTGRGTTANVRALTLTPPPSVLDARVQSVRLTLDSDTLELPAGRESSLVRANGHWALGARPEVRAGGPIREVFDGPLLFVYGATDPGERAMNERVARAWARPPGARIRYPVISDEAYTPAMGAGRTLVLVGSPRANRVLASLAPRLPIRFEGNAVVQGERRFTGEDVGAVFAAPNPDDPSRPVLVIAGAGPLGTWRSRFLPDLVPDYVVYDGRVASARRRVLLGGSATVLAAGFFREDGAPEGDDRDPNAAPSDDGGE